MGKKNREGAVGGKAVNNVINVLLALGCLTILFPLYMTVIIAFKKPSEMTNDVAGALAFPSNWNFDNFIEALKVTDFWRSLGNSLLLTGVTVIICILLHSLAGYVIGRKMVRHKIFKASYFYIVSGMFVPFAVLMMPLVKQTSQIGLANRAGVILLYVVFFMPMNILLYAGYLKNIPIALEEYTSAGTVKFPVSVRNQLQSCICFLFAGTSAYHDFLYHMPEADYQWSCKRSSKIETVIRNIQYGFKEQLL